jgi:iron complex outermembrane receptor protein
MHSRKCLLAAICLLAAPTQALADAPARVDIAPGRLDSSIVTLGRQAGISIGITDRQLGAQRVRRLRGVMSAQEALRRLLDDSNARAVRLSARDWRIVRAAPSARPSGTPLRLAVAAPAEPVEAAPEIVVTGVRTSGDLLARREQGLIALDGSFAIDAHNRGSDALAERVPGLGSTQLGPGRNRLFLRAIADTSFNGPTQAVVGQYLGTARLNYNAPDPDLRLIDLNLIEVRQGPQGTLYGAGTLGGVIRLLPNMPDSREWQAAQSASLAATWHGEPSFDASAMVNIPLIEGKAGLRAVVYAGRDGGYIDERLRQRDDINRVHTTGGRIIGRLEPGDGWTIDLLATAQTIDGRDSQYADRLGDRLDRASAFAQPFRNRFRLGQASIGKEWDAFELLTTTTITGLDLDETFDATEAGGSPSLFRQRAETRLIANETRLSGMTDGGLNWLVGGQLLDNRYRIRRARGELARVSAISGIENRVEEATAFADLVLPVTPRLVLMAGGRLTHARLSGKALETPLTLDAFRVAPRRSQTAFLPSAGLRYRFSDALSGHVRYQEGFRPGGISVRDDMIRHFLPDNVAAIEAGLALARGNFSADATLSFTRWRNIQADLIDADGLPATENIGDGRIVTLDANMAWQPLPGLTLEASGVWADSRLVTPSSRIFLLTINRNSAAGAAVPEGAVVVDSDDLPNVARWSGRLGASWKTETARGETLTLGGSLRYVGTSRLGIGPVLGVRQGDVLDTSLSVELARDGRSFWIRATNLLDSRGNRFAMGSPFTLAQGDQITPLRPRTIAIGADFSF